MNLADFFCDTQELMPIEQAMALLISADCKTLASETVPLDLACSRILASDVCSNIYVPPHDNSAMDGYAFAHDSCNENQSLKLVGESFAGRPFDGEVNFGECVRIMTGAVIPSGCDTVIMQERTEVNERWVKLTAQISQGSNVRSKGEDIAQGEVILAKGRRLSPADVGLLSSIGIAEVAVNRRLKVALFSTGDELKQPPQPLLAGDIYESNRVTIRPMLMRLGVDVIDFGIIADDKDQLRQVFKDANSQADVVISTGGVSVGEADYTKDILTEQGQIGFWKLAIKPGKPLAFGQLQDSYFIGLPGNPVSAMVTFHQLALPFLQYQAGETVIPRPRVKAKLVGHINKRPGRADFQRGVYQIVDGEYQVGTTGKQGSGILSSMSKANCYIVLAREAGNVVDGEMVMIEPFDQYVV